MALEYTSADSVNTLQTILSDIRDEYVSWFTQVAVANAYPEAENIAEAIEMPESFAIWAQKEQLKATVAAPEDDIGAAATVSPEIFDNLIQINNDLFEKGRFCMDIALNNARADFTDFDEFKNLFESFMERLSRVSSDQAVEGAGIDARTGLRSAKTAISDIKKELERASRSGAFFSMMLVQIDFFSHHEDREGVLAIAVENIKKCMRVFDDAYYLGAGMFLVSLKQSDIIGAQAATTRLQQFIRTDEKNTMNITLSYCMSEPVAGDDVSILIDNMKSDLGQFEAEGDSVLKFVEVSPLQRYLDSVES